MTISREQIEKVCERLWEIVDSGDWAVYGDFFSPDCSWSNSIQTTPIRGRKALGEVAPTWGMVHNVREWVAIDGNRLVVGWRERMGKNPGNAPWYTGVSSFLLNDDGLIQEYHGTFDVASAQASWNYREEGEILNV